MNSSRGYFLLFATTIAIFQAGVTSAQQDTAATSRLLFNGENLAGWVPVNTAPSTWSVQDGMLMCTGKPIGELRTDRMYQNFVLELEWRHLVPKGNAGVFVWADDITARGQPFHRGIEVQVLENAYGNNESHTTHGDVFPIHGATMTPINSRGGSRAFPTEFRSKPSPEWNHYRIECRDGNISLAVNGVVVTRGENCKPRKGYICLESEGGIVHYRNIRISELPDTPLDPDLIATADRGYRCLYNGVDLTGWQADGEWTVNDWQLRHNGDSPGRIATREEFGDVGFIVDFEFNNRDGDTAITLRGVTLDFGRESAYSEHLVTGRRANRIEGTLQGDKLTLSINGREVESAKQVAAEESGPLALHADSSVRFSNIYVRPVTR
jgi:hypothetical protein